MSYKHTLTLKLYRKDKGTALPGKISAQVNKMTETGELTELSFGKRLPMNALTKQLESLGHKVSKGISGGCYGARDGKSYDGLTVYLDATQFTERFIDSQGDEVVNIYSLIETMGGELIEDLDWDVFRDACEDLGCKVSRNNTYNYAEHDSETPYFLVIADYSIIEGKNCSFLAIKFHCGGDIRGNYTDTVVFKFSGLDDIYSVVYPTCELKGEVES